MLVNDTLQLMTITAKRIFYLLAFFVFLVLGPIALLYAWGYRYDFIKQKVQVTGIIYLKSYPRRATVILNGQTITHSTPAQLTGLTPGYYNVQIIKDDMWTWKKQVPVVAQRATFLEDIVLFKIKPDINLISADQKIISLDTSPDRQYLTLIKQAQLSSATQLQIIDSGNKQLVGTYLLPPVLSPYKLIWSNNSRRLVIMGDKQALGIVLGNPKNPVVIQPPATWLNLRWDINNDNILIANSPKGLWQFDLANKRWQNLATQPMLFFTQRYNQPDLIVTTNKNGALLTTWPFNDQNWQLYLSSSTKLSINGELTNDGILTLQEDSNILWLINTTTTQPHIIKQWTKPTDYQWSPAGNILGVLNDDGLNLLNLTEGWSDTIKSTTNETFNNFKWYPGGTHVYLTKDHNLSIAEIDPRGERNIHTLLSTSTFSGQFVTSRNNSEIFWLKDISSTSTTNGLYSLIVQ